MDESPASASESKLPLILAVVALAIGATGVFFGANSRSRAVALEAQVATLTEKAKQTPDVSAQLSIMQSQIDSLRNDRSAAELRAQTERGFQDISNAYQKLDAQVKALAQAVSGRGTATPPPPRIGTTTTPAASGEYVVVAGDIGGKIATKLGVKWADIEAANPGIDATRLQPGQKIKIPAR